MNRPFSASRNACALLLGLASFVAAQAAVVTSVQPSGARLDASQSFTVNGSGLANVSIEDCVADVAASGTVNQMVLNCLPQTPGPKNVLVAGVPSGFKVAFDHPTRQGNAGARGIPAVAGVSLFNGNYHHQATDMAVPGKGLPFTLSRSYNSYWWAEESKRGGVDECNPWRFNWEVNVGWVPNKAGQQLYVEQADGSGASFFKHTDGKWYPMDQGRFDQIEVTAATITVRNRAGQVQVFSAPDINGGRLLSVADAFGQALVLTYGAHGKVATVKDTLGLTYYFSYDGVKRLTSVDNLGRADAPLLVRYTWERDFEPNGVSPKPCSTITGGFRDRLATVTDIRGKTTSYSYTATQPKLLTRITDPSGRPVVQVTHAKGVYGSNNWGVSSVANGVGDAWRFGFCADSAASPTDAPACLTGTVAARQFRTTVTPPQGPARVSYFDTSGRPSGVVDGNGNRSLSASEDITKLTSLDYNRAGLPLERQSPLAVAAARKTVQFEHDAVGLLKTVKDALGSAHLTSWAGPNGVLAGNPASNLLCPTVHTTPEGLATVAARDAFCRVIEQAQPGKPAAKLSYATAGMPNRPDRVTDPRQNATGLEYDAMGNLKASTGPMGEVTRYTFDRQGRQITQTNPLGGITRTEYEGASNLVSKVTDPLGRITQSSYDASGNLKTRTAANGQVTSYGYDNANRLVEASSTVATAAGPQVVTTKTVYDALGRVAQTVNANNHASTTTFDNAGNALSRANALAQATSYQYDADSRVTRITDPAGRNTDTVYDALGRVTSVTNPAGTQSYDYDRDGRVVRHVDARGNATRYRYDAITGHLVEVTDAKGSLTTAGYDEAGNVTRITDPNDHTTTFEFDKSNRRTKRTDANGHVWTWDYDKAGNMTKATAPGGLISQFVYDTAGQLTQSVLPNSAPIGYTYNNAGTRSSMLDATGTTAYAYDGLRRLTQVTDPRGKVLKYAYDPAGNRIAITYPHSKVVGYGFDAAERLTSVSDWLGKTHRYTLNAAGQVTRLALGNGASATMVYDAASRLKSLANTGPADAVISSHSLTMDPEGNITDAAVQLPLLPSFASGTKTMTYDLVNRLATVDGAAVAHDDAGRLTGLGTEGYAYDARDLLTTITGPNAGSYSYNGAGHRVARTVGATTTRYVVDPNADLPNVLAETDGAGALLRSYVHGYGLLMQISAADVPRYYHFDPTGHTLALTDASGAVTDRYAYTPYGETTSSGATVNPFRFVGKFGVMDDGNGLLYMRARYFDVRSSRFLGLDSIESGIAGKASLNRYIYALANPIVYADATGLTASSEILGASVDKLRHVIGESAFDELTTRLCPNLKTQLEDCKNMGTLVKLVSSGLEGIGDLIEVVKSGKAKVTPGLDGLTILYQLSSGKNVSLTGGDVECLLDQSSGNPLYMSMEQCKTTYRIAIEDRSEKYIDMACDVHTVNSESVCFGAIYFKSLGGVLKVMGDNIQQSTSDAANSQVVRDSFAFWKGQLRSLVGNVLK